MKKIDEKEMGINLKAIKWSWAITGIALLLWAIYDYITTYTYSIVLIILNLQITIYFAITQVCKWKAGIKIDWGIIIAIILFFLNLVLSIWNYFFH